jgi:hypothetical protein
LDGGGGNFLNGHTGPIVAPIPSSRSRAIIAVSRDGHKASMALTIATAVLWFPEPNASCMEGGSVADPDRFGPDPDLTSENRPDPDSST